MAIPIRRFATAGALVLAALAPQARAADSLKQCFSMRDFGNWRAPDARTIYFRAATGHVYRIDLARQCAPLKWSGARLITRTFGMDLICSPADLNLRASEGPGGIAEPCFVKGMTELSQAEADALPKGARP